MTENQKTLFNLLKPRVLGMRIETILKRSGMTETEIIAAASGMDNVVKFKTCDWTFGYRIFDNAQTVARLALPRNAVPMCALPTYTGETKRAGAVI
jgi:hypothetical protein